MRRIRVIPSLLIQNEGLVKSIRFKNHQYIGDPINAVKIFNEKEADELSILDISAGISGKPNFKLIGEIVGEAFVPVAYGGGIRTVDDVKKLFGLGIEKIILNTAAFTNPKIIQATAAIFGSQSVVISIDVKKMFWGQHFVFRNNGSSNTFISPVVFAKKMESMGAGEILLTSIDRDGTFKGYDLPLIKKVAENIEIPVIANGGAGKIDDFYNAIKTGNASAVAAGSMFVLQRPHRAVLINYPQYDILQTQLFNKV